MRKTDGYQQLAEIRLLELARQRQRMQALEQAMEDAIVAMRAVYGARVPLTIVQNMQAALRRT